jgi:signal peptidase II
VILTQTLRRALVVAALVFALDRATKIYVVEVLGLPSRLRIEVFDPWFNLTMAWNRGINFGLLDMGEDGRWVLIGVAFAIVIGLLVWTRRARGWPIALGVGLVVGGAIGNVWDRVQWGAVADFANMSCCGIDNPFAFNVADAAIFLGAVALILFAGEGDAARRRKPRKKA